MSPGPDDEPTPRPAGRAADGRAFAVLLVLAACLPFAVYPQFVSDDALLYAWDSGQSHLSRFRTMAQALDEGGLALWQTIAYAGGPFHANPENPSLYPPVLLLVAWLEPLLALNLTVLGHLSLAIVGMALLVRRLARRLALPALAAPLLAGLLFGLNSYTRIEHFNLVTYGAAHALLPWLVLAADALLTGPSPRRAAGALALLLGLAVATGGLYAWAYGFLGLLIWFLFMGLLGGQQARRRTLTWGLAAAAAGGLMIAAKLLPYLDWVATTNRAETLDPEFAKGVTLAGHHAFVWDRLVHQVLKHTGQGLVPALALGALPLLRHGVVRLVVGLGLCGVLVAAGPLYEVLYRFVPPFDVVRNAVRGWTLANVFLPAAAGLGVAWVLDRARAARRAELLAAPVLCALALPVLLATGRHDGVLAHPWSYEHALSIYTNWPEMARRAGDDWRAMSMNVQASGVRNEQFIASALGVETPAGFLGHAFPEAIARHVYSNHAPLRMEPRLRRAAVLSVRYYVYSQPPRLRDRWADEPFPGGIDGPLTGQITDARPRAFRPAAVAAVFGDDATRPAAYAVLDAPAFRVDRASVLSFADGELPGEHELADIDEVVVVPGEATSTPAFGAFLERAAAAGAAVTRVELPLDRRARHRLAAVAARLSAGPPAAGEACLTRLASDRVSVTRQPATSPGFLVLSETWTLYGGWRAETDAGRRPPLRRADGVVTALHLHAGEATVEAWYAPDDVRTGLALGAVGLAAALALVLLPGRRRGATPNGPGDAAPAA